MGLCAVVLGTCLCWERPWQRAALLGVCALGLLICMVCRTALTQGIAALANGIGQLLTERTGYYRLPFETSGMNGWTLCLLTVLTGGLTAAAVRVCRGLVHFCCALAVLALAVCGILEGSIWLALYLAGTVLLLIAMASGTGKPMLASALLVALLFGCFGAIGAKVPATVRLTEWLHQLRYEPVENPLPEGNLQNLGAFTPTGDAALEITMEDWSAVYLRGFVGSTYTGRGWAKTDLAAVAENAELLYTLQRDSFFPSTQRGAAETALGNSGENTFALRRLDACGAWTFVPYGAGGLALDPQALAFEGCTGEETVEGVLYPVSDSYMTQANLAGGDGDSAYLDGEAAYRQWVFSQYLQVPESDYRLLADRFSLPAQTMTTTEARIQVLSWVQDTLTYDESAVMAQGDLSFLEYLLTVNPRGYSVQYATLATLLMRCCGIPARYVEGYLLSGTQAQTMAPGDWAVLTQQNSHAWTEIYLDGVGWIPFDTTPDHQNEIRYALPPDGSVYGGTAQQQTTGQNPQSQQQDILIQQQQETTDTGWKLPWQPILLTLSVLILLCLLVRTVWLRMRLKKRVRRFQTDNARTASLDCLDYTYTVLKLLGLPERNVPLTRRTEEIAALLDLPDWAPVTTVVALAEELQFSNHPATEEHRAQALECMETVCTIWKQKTGLLRRIWTRWAACEIL